MWTGAYWTKSYWAGAYWTPAGAIIAAAAVRYRGFMRNVGKMMNP